MRRLSNEMKAKYIFFTEDLSNDWDVTTASGDIVEVAGNSGGANFLKISKNPLVNNTTTTLLSKFIINPPTRIQIGMSMSNRISGNKFSIIMCRVNDDGTLYDQIPVADAVPVTTASQTTTTLTITTSTPHGFTPGDRIAIYGTSDSRANYSDVIMETWITPYQFSATFDQTAYATLPSVSISATGGYVVKVDPLNNLVDSIGMIFEGTSATTLKTAARRGDKSYYQLNTTGQTSTATIRNNSLNYCNAIGNSVIWDIRWKNEGVIIKSYAPDSLSTNTNIRRNQNAPTTDGSYKIMIVCSNNIGGLSRPIAKIASASKSGSTTATITTDVPHGLTTASYVRIYGIRDQTNFANLTSDTVVASVINSTSFTIVIPTSATATSYGGYVLLVEGGHGGPVVANAVQSLSRVDGKLILVGTATWSGFGVGDTIQLVGVYDTSGNDLGYDGAYVVERISTTTLYLASSGADVGSVNCGGGAVIRTDFRLNFVKVTDYIRQVTEIDGGNGVLGDVNESIPVNIVNALTVSGLSGGQANHDAAISGNPLRVAGRAITANYTGVATGDTADLITTTVGALVTIPNSIPQQKISASIVLTTASDTSLFAAAGSGIINYVTSLQVQNTSATATTFILKDSTTAKWTISLPASMTMPVVVNFTDPILMTANTVTNVACGTTGANVYVNAQGYKAP